MARKRLPLNLPNEWVRWPWQFTKVIARAKDLRSDLARAWVIKDGEDTWIYGTDYYHIVRVKVEEGAEHLLPGPISRKALRALESAGAGLISEHVEPLSDDEERVTYNRPKPDKDPPALANLFKTYAIPPKRRMTVAFSAKMLMQIAEAMGTGDQVVLVLDRDHLGEDYLKAIHVEPPGKPLGYEAQALLMPIRQKV